MPAFWHTLYLSDDLVGVEVRPITLNLDYIVAVAPHRPQPERTIVIVSDGDDVRDYVICEPYDSVMRTLDLLTGFPDVAPAR